MVHVDEWQLLLATWRKERQDNPLLYKPEYNEIWEFWEIASSHCPFPPCLAHALSSLEALPWILLTPKVACTSRHPIRTFWAKIPLSLFCLPPVKQVVLHFPFSLVLKTCFLLVKWTCFAVAKKETCCSLFYWFRRERWWKKRITEFMLKQQKICFLNCIEFVILLCSFLPDWSCLFFFL